MVHALTLTGHHPGFTGDIGVTLGVARCVGFDKYITTCIHPSGVLQSVFTALRILGVPPVCSLLLPPALISLDNWVFPWLFGFESGGRGFWV